MGFWDKYADLLRTKGGAGGQYGPSTGTVPQGTLSGGAINDGPPVPFSGRIPNGQMYPSMPIPKPPTNPFPGSQPFSGGQGPMPSTGGLPPMLGGGNFLQMLIEAIQNGTLGKLNTERPLDRQKAEAQKNGAIFG